MKINRNVISVAAFFILNCFLLFGENNDGISDGVVSDSVSQDIDTTSKSTDSAEAVVALSAKIENLTASISSQSEKIDSLGQYKVDFMLIFAIVLSLFVLCIVIFLHLKVRRLGNQIDELSRTIKNKPKEAVPSNTSSGHSAASFRTETPNQNLSPIGQSPERPAAKLPATLASNGNRSSLAGQSPRTEQPLVVPPARQSTTIVPPAVAPQAMPDTISPLYSSQEKRDNRRNGQSSDVFFDIDQDTYSQIMQGEKVQLLFEKRGSYIISPFVCINNCLYINFHLYNETKTIPADKKMMLSNAFEVVGVLPGKIIKCTPAQMEKKEDKYYVSTRGKIEIGSLTNGSIAN
jgi:hypothetical protein